MLRARSFPMPFQGDDKGAACGECKSTCRMSRARVMVRRTPWRMNRSELDAVDVLAVGRGRSETLLIPCSCSSEHMSDVWVVVAFVHRLSLAGQKRVVIPSYSEQSAFPSKRKWQVGWRSGIAFWLLSDSSMVPWATEMACRCWLRNIRNTDGYSQLQFRTKE